MSIYQVAPEKVHVLSVASQGGKIPQNAYGFLQQFGRVITWFDNDKETEPAERHEILQNIPAALSMKSAHGMDANDCLQRGILADVIEHQLSR